jgi:ribosomal protein S12 methylthiotransferase
MGCRLLTWGKYARLFVRRDDVPDNVKQDRANEIMELQSQISWI